MNQTLPVQCYITYHLLADKSEGGITWTVDKFYRILPTALQIGDFKILLFILVCKFVSWFIVFGGGGGIFSYLKATLKFIVHQ